MDNVLELANLDSGTPIPTDTKVEINALCRQWVEKAKNSLKPGVELVYQPEQDELHLYTNPGRLTQVVSHLLHNSARFTEKAASHSVGISILNNGHW